MGPREELERFGIDVRVELPGVGTNLQDRYEVGVVSTVKDDFSSIQKCTFGRTPDDPCLVDWRNGKGVYTTNGAPIGIVKKSSVAEGDPDLFIFGGPANFRGYQPGYSDLATADKRHFTWAILKGHSRNRAGTVRIARNNMFSWIPGIGGKFDEEWPGPSVQTNDQVKEFVRNEAWGHHASCTCPIGADDDPMAVLDSRFRVRGTSGLRVVDASVFPYIPGFFIVVPIYMVSEKATDVILEDAGDQRHA